MADESTTSRMRDEVSEDTGPGGVFSSFLIMEELYDKLKLLNYEREFRKEVKLKPISKHFFVLQTNSGEQFYMFTTLAAWLIRKCAGNFETPQEFDDPNSTIANILDILRSIGVQIEFPPSKLKAGFGEHVIFVLDRLADQALKLNNFQWKKPVYIEDEEEEEVVIDDSVEITLEKVEEELLAGEDDEEEEGPTLLDLEEMKITSRRVENLESTRPGKILEGFTDFNEWQLEVERVMPQLKVTISSDSRDWRNHVEQMLRYRNDIGDSLSVTRLQLDKLHEEVSRTLEKIGAREKYLNNQEEQLLIEYRSAQDQLAQAKEQYRSVSGGVTERSQTLAQITEEMDQIKQEMDEKGSSMTDGTPLVNIRKALSRLKTEVGQMDVRIGVALHTLLQAKLKEKGNLQKAYNLPPTTSSIDSVF